MCGLERQCTNSPEPIGPTGPTGPNDESFTYSLTEKGQRALAAQLLDAADASARSRARARALRQQGRRCGTVTSRWRLDRYVPEVRLSGAWLEAAGFALGREFEVGVEAGKLMIRAV